MLKVFNFFSEIVYKFKFYFLLGAGLLAWYFRSLSKARNEGRKEVQEKINKETQKVRDEWSKIDNSDVSIDDAINGLHKHSRKDRNP